MNRCMLVFVMALFVASLLVTGCSYEASGTANSGAKSTNLGEVRITVNEVYVDQPWLIVELTLRNEGTEAEYFNFAPYYQSFYLQDSAGHTYKGVNAYDEIWEEHSYSLIDFTLEPKETTELTLQCFDVPEDTEGLSLFCKQSTVEGETRISIPLQIGLARSSSEIAVDEAQSHPESDHRSEAAIGWAESHVGSHHWHELCLRFVANAFMQCGDPPAQVPEGTWTSAWDAVDRDEGFDLALHNPSNWRSAPRGALIFFGQTSENSDGHVGICLGDGEMIHAYGVVRIDGIEEAGNLHGGRLIGSYVGWAYPPERWRPRSSVSPVSLQPYPTTPEEVVRAYFEAASRMDYDGVQLFLSAKLIDVFLSTFPSEDAFLRDEYMQDMRGQLLDEDLAAIRFITEFVADDIARVSIALDGGGVDEIGTLILENGLWKLTF